MTASWLRDAVARFGASCREKLAGPGDREAAIRSPLELLLTTAGTQLGVRAVFHDEVRVTERRVRPDYALSIGGAIGGYVEVKAPGRSIDPSGFTGHDLRQWERQRDLPNLLYTNGTDWRLYRDGEPLGAPAYLRGGPLESAGTDLVPPAELETLLTDFLQWHPTPITSVGALVRSVAPLTRLLRGEVLDQIAIERRRVAEGADPLEQPFLGLAADWRQLLFPHADDDTFADGYAQTVTFALLLARTENIELADVGLHEVGQRLGSGHSLMGTALQLLTDRIAGEFKVTLDLLVRIVDQVQWDRVRRGRRDTYLHLYERFLDEYDPALRRQSGSYYTPHEVVEDMVRLTDQALRTRLGVDGFADPSVITVDPAMGTGTYLHAILEHVGDQIEAQEGAGAVPGALADLATRLIGFELQMSPYAVAELRTTDLLRDREATPPGEGLKFFVTNTLDDPAEETTQLGSAFGAISRSRRLANQVKANTPVTVVIGNPPYKELAVGDGGWVESGTLGDGERARPILEDWYAADAGRFKAKLKNLYVYFWRWASWKVWETNAQAPEGNRGIVCFISTAGYLTGPGFTGMRQHLRQHASEGWIIDLTPEGHTPEVGTRVFPHVRQPLAIGLFVRALDNDETVPATLRYRTLRGSQANKFAGLAQTDLDDNDWHPVRTGWTAPFTPAAETDWDDWPATQDLMPWYSPGVFPTRTWVYSPAARTLVERWNRMTTETNALRQDALFKVGRDARPDKNKAALPGSDTHQHTRSIRSDPSTPPAPVRVGYRAFDRQWILPDSRVMDMPRSDLWAARTMDEQLFIVEQHRRVVRSGPGLMFSALIPDFDYFKGSEGGRAFPARQLDNSANLATGLASALGASLGTEVEADDLIAYLAAVTAHPGYTATFRDELVTPGVRVPMTSDPALWHRAVELGREVVWLHTYGARYADATAGRPAGRVRLPGGDPAQPLSRRAVTTMPTAIAYDETTGEITLGGGVWGPVIPEVWAYTVGGRPVVQSWFNYRKADPAGRRSSPLDDLNPTGWPAAWTTELTDLLTVLTRLTALEPSQEALLADIVGGPMTTVADLTAAGVRWPTTARDRKPRRPAFEPHEGTLDIAP